jgi:hypothetical protein
MTHAALAYVGGHYGTEFGSDAVGAESATLKRLVRPLPNDTSITLGQSRADAFARIAAARHEASMANWDGEGAAPVGAGATGQAIQLLFALPSYLPVPEITPEPTGEVAFEWYVDARHVAVLSVDGSRIRWSVLAGTNRTSGSEIFARSVPSNALLAITQAIPVV